MRIATAPPSGVKRIADAFADSGKRAAFMPYLMGGFPDLATSCGIGEAYAAAGADLVELGVPFSDPLADGPVIQAAGTAALEAGATVERNALDGLAAVVARARTHAGVPVAVGFGISTPEHAAAAAVAGADGVIVGSRLVRAAAEADDPPGAAAALVGEFAAALR